MVSTSPRTTHSACLLYHSFYPYLPLGAVSSAKADILVPNSTYDVFLDNNGPTQDDTVTGNGHATRFHLRCGERHHVWKPRPSSPPVRPASLPSRSLQTATSFLQPTDSWGSHSAPVNPLDFTARFRSRFCHPGLQLPGFHFALSTEVTRSCLGSEPVRRVLSSPGLCRAL